jgi:hypothetical protein
MESTAKKVPAVLTVQQYYQNNYVKSYRIESLEAVLGRESGVTLDLSPDGKVSRRHGLLYYDLSTWWVKDLESRHGIFINGQRINQEAALCPGDVLQAGNTILHLDFLGNEIQNRPGAITESMVVSEAQPPENLSEDRNLELLVRISTIMAHSKNGPVLMESLIHEIASAFPQTQHQSIALIEEHELVPCVWWPPSPQAHLSFTLARQSIKTYQALSWVYNPLVGETIPNSLSDTTAALYAPIFCNGQVIGTVHADSNRLDVQFTGRNLSLMSVIANMLGPVLKVSQGSTLTRLPYIFISYVREERDFVRQLAADLRRHRVKIWFDDRLQGGLPWRDQLDKAIQNVDALALVMSPTSVSSEYVAWEYQRALELGKTVIPLRYQKCQMPATLQHLQYINLEASYEVGLSELISLLNTLRPSTTEL